MPDVRHAYGVLWTWPHVFLSQVSQLRLGSRSKSTPYFVCPWYVSVDGFLPRCGKERVDVVLDLSTYEAQRDALTEYFGCLCMLHVIILRDGEFCDVYMLLKQ